MPVTLEGACQCRAVGFRLASHTPYPYQRCYCGICRKTAGGGGFAINLMGRADSLTVEGGEAIATLNAVIADEGPAVTSEADRAFCSHCGSALWLHDRRWPDLVHPQAGAIDTALPVPPALTHVMLDFKPAWVAVAAGPDDETFPRYPDRSIENWHRARGLWID